jgi:branched-subunit amino acid aminotransferase/4-amino-4-deoxychorismate lyase
LLAASAAGIETREGPITLQRMRAADEILLTSSISGLRPATLRSRDPRFEVGALLRAALADEPAGVVAS